MKEKRLIIVGGGVIGLCSAYYAMQRGHRVTIVDRGAPDHDCCSLGNAGLVSPSHIVPLAAPGMVSLGLRMMLNPEGPFSLRPRLSFELFNWAWKFFRASSAAHVLRGAPVLRDLSLASRRCFEELAEISGNGFGLVKKGLLVLCRTERALIHESATAIYANGLGIEAQVLTPEETARRMPELELSIAGSVYFPIDCHLSPTLFMGTMTRELERGGVEFVWNTEINGWRTSGRRVTGVVTGTDPLSADEFVLAGGAWSSRLASGLGLRLPMQAGKGYSLTLEHPKRMPDVSSILNEARIAVTPMGSKLRFAGTMEIVGMDSSINAARIRGILKSIPKYFPEFSESDFRETPVWSGLRPCSPDGLPYVGRVRNFENLCIATGHAMLGLSLGPITGKLVSEIVSGESPSVSIELLSPDRYA